MTNKLFMFFLVAYVYGTLLAFMMAGEISMATTTLTSPLSKLSTTIPVANTTGFLSSDYIWVDDEIVSYTALTATSFTGTTRGAQDTDVEVHTSGARVYSGPAGDMNQIAGFNILSGIADDGLINGTINAIIAPFKLATTVLPRIITWDFEFLEGQASLVKMFLFILSGGLVFAIGSWIFRRA